MIITALLIAIVSALTLALYYDYRYRRHWTGHTFGYPLRGFEDKLFFTFDDGPACFGKVLKGENDTQPISDPVVRDALGPRFGKRVERQGRCNSSYPQPVWPIFRVGASPNGARQLHRSRMVSALHWL